MTLDELCALADKLKPVGPSDYRMNLATYEALKCKCVVVESRPVSLAAVSIWIDPTLADGEVKPGKFNLRACRLTD